MNDNTRSTIADDAQQLSIGIGLNGNKGFEGLAFDPGQKRLFVAKERDPLQIYVIKGSPQSDPAERLMVNVNSHSQLNAQLFVRDLSGLLYDKTTGHLQVVSDQSHVVLELTTDGKPISQLSLHSGQHGLTADVPQAEGFAMDANGNLYIVSEPNLFYAFKKQRKEQRHLSDDRGLNHSWLQAHPTISTGLNPQSNQPSSSDIAVITLLFCAVQG